MIQEGHPLPEFELQDQNGNTYSNATLKGKKAVLYFYPKDDTSGCTAEACDFRDNLSNFEGVHVFGVSPDTVASHTKFSNKYDLNFPLLADPELQLLNGTGVWVEKSMYGKKYMGVERTTLIVDESGVVRKVFNKVKPKNHSAEVLDALKQLN
jgi:peroxiredoxin Q/BCP